MDHPIALVGLEERVSTAHAFAEERRDDLVVAQLMELVLAAVPDPHRARAVVAVGDVALEVEVLERMVFGVHREMVPLRRRRDALRHRPREEHSVVLEAEIPVQRARVMLLHDEARPFGRRRARGGVTARFRRRVEVALGAVLLEGAAALRARGMRLLYPTENRGATEACYCAELYQRSGTGADRAWRRSHSSASGPGSGRLSQ